MTSRFPTAALVSASLLYALAPHCFADEAGRIDRLTIALDADPVGTAPALHFHAPGKLVIQHVGEALVAHRDDMSIAPMLAERVDVSDDGLTYAFRIRKDVHFHNGKPVTATDVSWVWNDYYLNPETEWHCKSFYDGTGSTIERSTGGHILSVKPLDSHIVEFRLAERSNLFLARMADVSCAPIIFHRDSFKADGSWDKLIGTGPYQFVSWEPGKRIVLKRFDGYVSRTEPRDGYAGAKLALAREIVLDIVPNRQEAFARLKAGLVDIVPDVQEAERMWLEGTPGIAIHTTSTINFWNLLIMSRNPALADIRMRRAIAHAIDLDYLAAVLTEGRQRANSSVISTNSHFHSAVHDRRIPFDIARARELLAEAGYDGAPIEIQTNRDGYPEMYRIGVLVRSMLQSVGINAVLKVMPWKEQLDNRYRNATFQLQAFGQGGRNHPALVYGKFIGPKSALNDPENTYERLQWIDDEAYDMVNRAEVAPTVEEQQAIYDDLHRRMLDQVVTLALLNFEYHDAIRAELRGFHTTPFMRTTLWGVSRVADGEAGASD
jgi:peptide/nickel transport system substrate-binding protein